MYLEHFQFSKLPFTLTPHTDFFCKLDQYQSALNVLLLSLRNGEGFIKITGEVGTGKTLLCHKLLDILDEECVTAFMPNPNVTPDAMQRILVTEIGVNLQKPIQQYDSYELLEAITRRLIDIHESGKRAVLIIDEAQALPLDTLEATRLLTNLETKSNKLLQVILFGQPELNEMLNLPSLRQLKQRIVFEYHMSALNLKDMHAYINHRLIVAGSTFSSLFTPKAMRLLYKHSGGIPRLINILSHKALLSAYGRGKRCVDRKAIRAAIVDAKVKQSVFKKFRQFLARNLFYIEAFVYISIIALLTYYLMQLRSS